MRGSIITVHEKNYCLKSNTRKLSGNGKRSETCKRRDETDLVSR